MAADGSTNITDAIIVRLAEGIAAEKLESLAMKHMDINWETLQNLKREYREDIEAFSRDVIRKWSNKRSSGPDQIKV